MAGEEYLLKLSQLQQETERLGEQIEAINQQIQEFEDLKESLNQIEKKEGKEILAGLGKGIFYNSEVKGEEVYVNIGSGIILKKKPKEAVGIIDKQIKQLGEMKNSLLNEMGNINFQLQRIVEEARKEKER